MELNMDLKFAGRVRLGIIDGNVARIWYVTKRIFSPQAAAFDAAFTLSFFLSRLLTTTNAKASSKRPTTVRTVPMMPVVDV